jgi:hypothetical protein
MTIEEILNSTELSAAEKVAVLKEKLISVPKWCGRGGLQEQFDPTKHPVMNKQKYPDEVTEDGVQPVSRVTVDLPRLAVKRIRNSAVESRQRVYKPENDTQKEIASIWRRYSTETASTA